MAASLMSPTEQVWLTPDIPYFTMGREMFPELLFPLDGFRPRLKHGFLASPEPISETTSRSLDPF